MVNKAGFIIFFIVFLIIIMAVLRVWRKFDIRAESNLWGLLQACATRVEPIPPRFHVGMLEDLPEPAQRYFRYTIAPGTPLRKAVSIRMHGELGFGSKHEPKYRPMHAEQILAPPYGLVWRLNSGIIVGSDAASLETSWTRFWFFGVIPLIRVGGELNHRRSAFGRMVAESVFWVPAALLPGPYVRWESIDHESARAVVFHDGLKQAVDVTVASDGQPTKIVINRWSNANKEKEYRLQPFGGFPSEFKHFDGYRLATRVEGGNHIGTEEYFPFYKTVVSSIQFIESSAEDTTELSGH